MKSSELDALVGSKQVRRWHAASKVKNMKDIKGFPTLSVWNYGPCEKHETPTPTCEYRKCGGQPFAHQRKTASFSYASRYSLVGNSTGTGKTGSALLTLALAHHYGEIIRAVIVVPSTAVNQWEEEIRRWTPGFSVVKIPPQTPKKVRLETYAQKWNLLVMGYHAFERDYENIKKCEYRQVVVDDVDPALDHRNSTFHAIDSICMESDLTIVMNATSLSMRLEQLWAATALIRGREVWGTITNFINSFVRKDKVWVVNRQGKRIRTFQTVGYKNMNRFLQKFRPMFIRITYEDIADDLNIPSLTSKQIYIDMSPQQKKRYNELQDGVRTILNDEQMPAQQRQTNALAAWVIGSQICNGLFALKTTTGKQEEDGPGASPKLDFIENLLTGDLKNEKVVVYTKYRGSMTALEERLDKHGIGHSSISGRVTDPELRKQAMDRFWEDPHTKVMIISVSGERSLNLQVARVLILWDLNLNPGRLKQLAGRVQRIGSKFKQVYVIQLLHSNSQEERYTLALSARQALVDRVFEEGEEDSTSDDMLIQKLDPEEILKLISP